MNVESKQDIVWNIKRFFKINNIKLPPHVILNSKVEPSSYFTRTSVTDGTLYFVLRDVQDTLEEAINVEFPNVVTTCEIGDIQITLEFGDLKDEIDPETKEWKNWYVFCQKSTIKIPVKYSFSTKCSSPTEFLK